MISYEIVVYQITKQISKSSTIQLSQLIINRFQQKTVAVLQRFKSSKNEIS